jgi:hypothetical protein
MMNYDYGLLEAKIKEKYYTKDRFATALGIGRTALYSKLQGLSQFKQNEIFSMVQLLGIKKNEITIYFFTPKVR